MANVEVRVNSAADAHSAVYHREAIVSKVLDTKADGLIFRVAQECVQDAMPILAGNFPCRVNYRTVLPLEDRILYQLPHWVAPQKDEPPIVQAPVLTVKRRPGRPKKGVIHDASVTNGV